MPMPYARSELERVARDMIGYAMHELGPEVGLTLFVFEFGDTGNLAYVSNAQRADMIASIKQWLARVESGLMTDPAGPRAE
ncbi:MAG TPA: hypothetical protein VJU58_13795 [Microbacterium sp.]|nr:hypothetical protein [Microbacterium sp.]